MRHECQSCHQFFPHRADCPLIECQHGVTYDHELVLDIHAERGIRGEEIRERWPRLDGKCPKGCGYEGLYYATMDHFSWGEWEGDIPSVAEVGNKKQQDMTILDVRWFTTGRGSVGIVCVEMPDDQEPPQRAIRYFIAPVDGHYEPSDKATVADWGARFPDEVGALLFGRVDRGSVSDETVWRVRATFPCSKWVKARTQKEAVYIACTGAVRQASEGDPWHRSARALEGWHAHVGAPEAAGQIVTAEVEENENFRARAR